MKNGPVIFAIVLAIAAGVIWFEFKGRAHKAAPQNAAPAAVTAPAAPADAPAQTKQEEKKAKDDNVIIG